MLLQTHLLYIYLFSPFAKRMLASPTNATAPPVIAIPSKPSKMLIRHICGA